MLNNILEQYVVKGRAKHHKRTKTAVVVKCISDQVKSLNYPESFISLITLLSSVSCGTLSDVYNFAKFWLPFFARVASRDIDFLNNYYIRFVLT